MKTTAPTFPSSTRASFRLQPFIAAMAMALSLTSMNTSAAPPCGNCGAVENIHASAQPGEASGLGAVAGGVVGAIVGSQIGGGTGRKIATVAGAAGGAYAGHQIEKSQRQKTQYEVVVRMDDGSRRSVMLNMVPGWQIGDRVRIEHGTLVRENE